jgi:hypothetical protein
MTESVFVLVLGKGSHIDRIGNVYRHEKRCKQSILEIEHSGLWDGEDRWIDCQRFDMIRARPYGTQDTDDTKEGER